MRQLRGQQGVALVALILVMVLMTVLAVAALTRAIAEQQASAAVTWDAKAFYAADGVREAGFSALEQYYEIAPGDSVTLVERYEFADNVYATAAAIRVDEGLHDWEPREFLVYGHGYTDPLYAEAKIAEYLRIDALPPWNLLGGFIALRGLRKNGVAGLVSGNDPDTCGSPVPGLIAGDSVSESGAVVANDAVWLDGSPPLLYRDLNELIAELGFDEWVEAREGPFDYEVDGAAEWPAGNLCATWPVIRVAPDVPLRSENSGCGIIIAPENLEAGGGFAWEGIILVGGHVRIDGLIDVQGTALSGLNVILGQPVPRSDLGNGIKIFSYNSCSVRKALRRWNPTVEYHGWHEVW
jgi:hypothetical protein